MAETLSPGGSPTRIYPVWVQGWVSVCKKAVYAWVDDRAPTMGAAIAYYTVFSLAPMLVMVIAVAGLAFGQQAAEGALFGERRPRRSGKRGSGASYAAERERHLVRDLCNSGRDQHADHRSHRRTR